MISFKEVLGNYNIADIPTKHEQNIQELLIRVNVLRTAYGKPLKVTSGYRSREDQIRIYNKKGVMDVKKIPMKSAHLEGLAIDVYDPNKEFQKWILANTHLLEEQGLYCEHFDYTANWVHLQYRMPASGNRFFKP